MKFSSEPLPLEEFYPEQNNVEEFSYRGQKNCPRGRESREDKNNRCTKCSAGYYKDWEGTGRCERCPIVSRHEDNEYGASRGYLAKQQTFTHTNGATSEGDCVLCGDNQMLYRIRGGYTCIDCPAGHTNSLDQSKCIKDDFLTGGDKENIVGLEFVDYKRSENCVRNQQGAALQTTYTMGQNHNNCTGFCHHVVPGHLPSGKVSIEDAKHYPQVIKDKCSYYF